jgi:hypothetical protein
MTYAMFSPLTQPVEILLKEVAVMCGTNGPIQHTVIREEAYLGVHHTVW